LARAPENGFFALWRMPAARLIEVSPAEPGQEAAALAFALAWALSGARARLIFWAAPEHAWGEHGPPHAEGLAQFGLALDQLLIARARTQADALWAAEQALTLPGACVLCTIAPTPKPLSLTATRRLLLLAEKHQSQALLLRFDPAGTSAAWLRWSIAAAPSQGEARELGPPSFKAYLTRNRAGPSGQSWRLQWSADERAFRALERAMDGDLAAAPLDRSVATRRRRSA
jgi:protein ImuA